MRFFLYSRATTGGGAYIKSSTVQSRSTKGGGGQTTSSGGGQTTSAGGGQTSSAGGVHRHRIGTVTDSTISRDSPLWEGNAIDRTVTRLRFGAGNASGSYTFVNTPGAFGGTPFPLWSEGASDSHTHTVSNHTHTVASHTHAVSDHTHDFDVTIPSIDIPMHDHDLVHGIYEHDKLPSSLEIKVDDTVIPHTALNGENVELTPYLKKDSNGKIARDRFAIVEIRPTDELAQINASIVWGLFVQSHKGSAM